MTDASKSPPHLRFWLLTLAALLAVGVTSALGFWQLSRAAEKERYQTSVESRGRAATLSANDLFKGGSGEALIHRHVTLQGHWLTDKTVFLDNRQMNAKPGFYVLTPLQLEGRAELVLVQRGWVARNFIDRTVLPPIASPAGLVVVSGRIVPPPAKLYELGETQGGAIRQNLDLAQFKAETKLPLLALSIQQLGAPSEGLLREWPQVASGIDKHYGYAFQWFGLSALIAILYVWFQLVKRYIAPKQP